MERIIHSNDNAREAKATIWIFEGSSLYVLIAAFALALAGFRYCYDGLGLGPWVSLLVGATPLVVAMVYVVTLKLGKPKSYDLDFFRSFAVRVMRAIAGTGLLLIRFELHGLSARKTRHPYADECTYTRLLFGRRSLGLRGHIAWRYLSGNQREHT